ncbi:MAG: hypothetical protein J3R72DRAFT_234426 [Linnemannia gamsii]|nr:MAG: hypothetical protein J3R72DRAFT_234426 [Linnemannia gamsii]
MTHYFPRVCVLHSVWKALCSADPAPTPDLLILFRCTYGSAEAPRQPTIATYVAAHCPSLRFFHLSMFEASDDVVDRELTSYFSTFPNMDELSVVDRDFYTRMSIRDGLRTVASRVMMLNILPFSDTMGPIIMIRDVLCTFEHLVHLQATNAVYFAWDMDLNNHLLQFKQDSTTMCHCPRYHHPTPFSVKDIGSGYIWACRRFKTLHLGYYLCARYLNNRTCRGESWICRFGEDFAC